MKEILNKCLSGRFILTLIAGLVFAILSVKGTLPVDKVHEVIIIVIYAYFSRNRAEDSKKDIK